MEYTLPQLTFPDMLRRFCQQAFVFEHLKKKVASNYKTYLNKLDASNNGNTITWIKQAISNSNNFEDRIKYIEDKFNQEFPIGSSSLAPYSTTDVKSALKKFTLFILTYFDARASLIWTNSRDPLQLAQLIADTALFAPTDIVNKVCCGELGAKINKGKGNNIASWDNMTSRRDLSNRKQNINGIYCDDNTRANHAIKNAILLGLNWGKNRTFSLIREFEACHVYEEANYPAYHTSLMNIILIPRSLAALTDFDDYVRDVLRYRVYEIYKFYPTPTPPTKPDNYEKIVWR